MPSVCLQRNLRGPDGSEWALEVKRSLAPTLERGFHSALADLQAQRALVVYPGQESYPLSPSIEAIPLPELCRQVRSQAGN